MRSGRSFRFETRHAILQGRVLLLEEERGKLAGNEALLLPFGAITSVRDLSFEVNVVPEKLPLLRALEQGTTQEIQILPAATFRRQIEIDDVGTAELEFFVVDEHQDRARAFKIIERCHYLEPPSRGLILCCKFLNPRLQSKIRQLAAKQNRRNSRSESWTETPGQVVACAVLDTLYHGNPLGRLEIPEIQKSYADDVPWHQRNRREILRRFRLSWVSRIAIDEPYRKYGIGTHLVSLLREVARRHRHPWARYVEVMRRLPAEEAKELLEKNEDDFLTRAGYVRSPTARPTGPMLRGDYMSQSGSLRVTAKQLYYYAPT
jgi:GNAT superfamily N-acetyltransferase